MNSMPLSHWYIDFPNAGIGTLCGVGQIKAQAFSTRKISNSYAHMSEWKMYRSNIHRSSLALICRLESTSFKVIAETQDQVEVSFTKTWNVSLGHNVVPLNIDKRCVLYVDYYIFFCIVLMYKWSLQPKTWPIFPGLYSSVEFPVSTRTQFSSTWKGGPI